MLGPGFELEVGTGLSAGLGLGLGLVFGPDVSLG